ncbi:MAG: Gfo/Idh/MocA family oxidoreductase [Gemmatimonadota bacterium]|nr:Gfo/Idh/MocA family oxidoreductase [Gemmatimonadota bacterium]
MTDRPVRVAVYGTGRFAQATHLPNLSRIDGVEIAALCDINEDALREAAAQFGVARTYTDAHAMLEAEDLDALWSIVPAFARTDVEIAAAERGIQLFSEKPQAIDMALAKRIDAAVRKGDVISTVGFRERYRPIFQEARRLLRDKRVVHVRFQQISHNPKPTAAAGNAWSQQVEKGGVRFFDWGVHATDYTRFMTGQDVLKAQAFLYHPEDYHTPLSSSFHYQLSEGATATLTFIESDPTGPGEEPYFKIYFDGGRLGVFGYERIEVNDEVVYEADPFDPWLAQDQAFVEAVRSGDPGILQSDYHDGLRSLAPILAGWDSARREGALVDVERFIEEA